MSIVLPSTFRERQNRRLHCLWPTSRSARHDIVIGGERCYRLEQYENPKLTHIPRHRVFFRFPEDACWNEDRQAVEFGIGVGEYEGIVRVPRQVFRRFIDGGVTPERCLEAYHLQRTRFELVAERKLRGRQLTDDGNVEINGRDLPSSTKSSNERDRRTLEIDDHRGQTPLPGADQARSRPRLLKGRPEIA